MGKFNIERTKNVQYEHIQYEYKRFDLNADALQRIKLFLVQ